MKGQLFIIAAIFMIVAIVLIRNMTGGVDLSEESRFQESRYFEKQLDNIMNEYRMITGASALQPDPNQTGMDSLRNISLMVKDDTDISVFYIFIFANGTSQNFTATFGNFLNDRMNITFNATNSNPTGTQIILENNQNKSIIFDSSPGDINLNITYLSGGIVTHESFDIAISSSNQVFGFFDVKLRDSGFFVREKEIYNWSWT